MNPAPPSSSPTPGRVLVTGGCGYVGSRLVPELVADPHVGSVRVLDSLTTGSLPVLAASSESGSVEFIEADILDPSSVDLALRDVDAVVHLAAVGETPVTFAAPEAMERVNRWGTSHLVNRCREVGVERFVFASTASVYGSGELFEEDSPKRPLGTFAQSKLAAEGSLRGDDDAMSTTVLRLGTVFGWADGVRFHAVPNRFAYWAGVGRSLSVFGSGEQHRPLLHVGDASDAVRFCLARPDATAGRTFNVATGNHSVLDVVEAIRGFAPDVNVRFTDQEALTHLSYRVDTGALTELGWSPSHDLQEGLEEVADRFASVRYQRIGAPEL